MSKRAGSQGHLHHPPEPTREFPAVMVDGSRCAEGSPPQEPRLPISGPEDFLENAGYLTPPRQPQPKDMRVEKSLHPPLPHHILPSEVNPGSHSHPKSGLLKNNIPSLDSSGSFCSILSPVLSTYFPKPATCNPAVRIHSQMHPN